jgi:hypothetical protein
MSVKINASSSSGLVVDSDLTGSLQLQTGGNPAISIDNAQVANFAKQFQIGGVLPPAFSAYLSSNQSISALTYTKVQLNTETFDTANAFDSTTNYRFTPLVAGYYQVNFSLSGSNAAYQLSPAIYKNGSAYLYTGIPTGTGNGNLASGSCVIYLNGSTDYIEFYGWQSSAGVFIGGSVNTQASAVLMRAA